MPQPITPQHTGADGYAQGYKPPLYVLPHAVGVTAADPTSMNGSRTMLAGTGRRLSAADILSRPDKLRAQCRRVKATCAQQGMGKGKGRVDWGV